MAVLGIVGLFFYLKTSNFDTEKRSLPTASRSAEHYQNGFDAQGMWVEVNVEKELNDLLEKMDVILAE